MKSNQRRTVVLFAFNTDFLIYGINRINQIYGKSRGERIRILPVGLEGVYLFFLIFAEKKIRIVGAT